MRLSLRPQGMPERPLARGIGIDLKPQVAGITDPLHNTVAHADNQALDVKKPKSFGGHISAGNTT